MLTGDKKTIQELLSGCKYSLVNNQRDYVWSLGSGQIDDFLYDVKYYLDHPDDKWFLGQIVLLKVEQRGVEEYKIIDGQQRLTTLCLFLAACRDKAKKLNNGMQEAKMQEYISFVNGADGSIEGLRISASKSIRDVFEGICTYPDFTFEKPENVPVMQWRKQKNKIANIFEAFNQFLENKDQSALTNTIKVVLETYVFRLISNDAAETYALFENTNAKGTPLEATDLLKNLLMEELSDNPTMESDWNDIANNSGTTGVRMLKYFYTSKRGTLERGNIYRKVRDDLVRRKADTFVKEYRGYSLFYRTLEDEIVEDSVKVMFNDVFEAEAILRDEQAVRRIFHAIQGIQLLQITLCYPMIYAMINAYMRNEKTDASKKALMRMFESLEKFHFVNTNICNTRANRVETLYAEYCEKFNNCNSDFVNLVAGLINKMRNEYTEQEAIFNANFKDLEYNDTNIGKNTLLYYIFDRFNNYDEAANRIVDLGGWGEFYAPSKNIKRHIYSIEHFSPKKPRVGEAVENVHNIGNLFMIGSNLNGRLTNLSPEEKIAKLRSDYRQDIGNNKMLRELVDNYANNWNEEAIDRRAEALATRAYNKIWNLR